MSLHDYSRQTPPFTTEGPDTRGNEWISDPVGFLSDYGDTVSTESVRHVMLGGRHTLWLVTGNSADLFAVDTVERGPWHFISRLKPGTVMIGSSREARHVLLTRPEEGCVVRRIPLSQLLYEGNGQQPGNHAAYLDDAQWAAVIHGVDLGISALHEFGQSGQSAENPVTVRPYARTDLAPGQVARTDNQVLWVEVDRGQVWSSSIGGHRQREAGEVLTVTPNESIHATSQTTLIARPTADLLTQGILWNYLAWHHAHFLHAFDRWVEQRRHADSQLLAEGRTASLGAVHQADQALRTVIQPRARRASADRSDLDDAAATVCRIVAEASGIEITPDATTPAAARREVDPVVRITSASRIRTRPVRLAGSWWRQDMGPLVAYLKHNQFPVALLWRRGRCYLVEPGSDRRHVTRAVAARIDENAVMFYRSLPEEPVRGLNLLRFGLRGTRTDILRLAGGGLAAFGVALAVPVATGQVLGEYVPRAQTSLIVQACLAVFISGVVSTAFLLQSSIAELRLQGHLDAVLQAAIWDRLLRLPAAFFTRFSTGELASAAMGISTIRILLSSAGVVVINAVIIALVNIMLLLWYSVPLGLMSVALLLAHGIVFLVIALRQLRWQRQLLTIEYRLSDFAFHTLQGLPKLRVAGAESFAYARWAGEFAKSRQLSLRVQRNQNLVSAINAGYVPACTLLLFMVLSGPARGTFTLAQFLTFLTSFATALTAAAQVTGAISSTAAVIPVFNKVKPILHEDLEVSNGNTVPPNLTGDIEISDVTFRYTAGAPLILDNISFHIHSGEFVAIVGPTGCGKSTLLRLLIGFNEPTAGTIRYDGICLAELDLSGVRQQCGVVLQNSTPLSGTIMSNICGTDVFTADEAWEAAKLAGLDHDIRKMPMGMHTLVGDGAGALSGGQRQRLMIAQALIRRPKILFFDEATSALDNETQATVAESTRTLSATRVVIAHRLSTIMHADRVVVLADGKVTQIGTPAELLTDEDGLFYRLVRRQIS